MKQLISIVVPVYHEEKNVKELLLNLKKNVKTKSEILIIYDSEKDPTVNAVKSIITKNKTKKISLVKNSVGNKRGVVNAIKSGFKKAKGDAVLVLMADLSDDLRIIDKMFKKIQLGDDIVCGSRYMRGGKKIGGPPLKTFLSKAAGISLYYLAKIPTHDSTNAFKMYRKSLLEKITIESTGGFEFSMELIIKAFKKGFKISEIPATWRDRTSGKSNFKMFKWLPNYLKVYFSAFTK